MVYSIFVSGTPFSGKTVLCLGMFGKFQEMGMKVGYFKPVGKVSKIHDGKPCDPDVLLMRDVMELEEEMNELCPITMGNRYLDHVRDDCNELKERISNAFVKVKDDKDVLLIESAPSPEFLTSCGLDLGSLSEMFL